MSLADQVSAALEKEIVMGELPTGMHLDEGSLATRFGTSRTPVREALNRLAESGLVELRPRRGAAVAGISEAAMAQRFEALAGFEGLCAYYAAERMTTDERLALRDAHRRCRAPAESGDMSRYDAADMIFHRLLKPWRRIQLLTPGRVEASYGEHEAIVIAVQDGDASRAEALTRAHVERQSQAADRMVASGQQETPP